MIFIVSKSFSILQSFPYTEKMKKYEYDNSVFLNNFSLEFAREQWNILEVILIEMSWRQILTAMK